MAHSLSSLSYKGSIAEAISEAKQQKKLFVVYTSGGNSESNCLESTWTDPIVTETLSKYCILLHILEGSSEARNFSEIYPQQSIPCITVVGYNGVQLWKNEGFVTADVLSASLERAWLSVHVQETTAAFLTAALAAGEKVSGENPRTSLSGQVSPRLHSSLENHVESPDAQQSAHLGTDRTSFDEAYKGATSTQDGGEFSKSSPANVLDEGSITEAAVGNSKADTVIRSSKTEDDMEFPSEVAEVIVRSNSVDTCPNREIKVESKRFDDSGLSTAKSNVVFLSIRLPGGSSTQVQFSVNDTLRMVKDHINQNEARVVGSFNIAIPYPRKVFSDQDLDRTLSELGFSSRQALILLPQSNISLHSGGGSLHHENGADASNATEGYWPSLRRILSYVSPFSYLTGTSRSNDIEQSSETGSWPHRPNPNTPSDEGAWQPSKSSRPSTSSSNRNNRQLPSRFGANIHTLGHEGDDDHSNDRNTFWNGNSTQFGGDDDGK